MPCMLEGRAGEPEHTIEPIPDFGKDEDSNGYWDKIGGGVLGECDLWEKKMKKMGHSHWTDVRMCVT